jgi:hypothetical protein
MERDEHRDAVVAWAASVMDPMLGPAKTSPALSNALYSFTELGLLEGIDSLDVETAVQIWAIVQTAKEKGFPDELRM